MGTRAGLEQLEGEAEGLGLPCSAAEAAGPGKRWSRVSQYPAQVTGEQERRAAGKERQARMPSKPREAPASPELSHAGSRTCPPASSALEDRGRKTAPTVLLLERHLPRASSSAGPRPMGTVSEGSQTYHISLS